MWNPVIKDEALKGAIQEKIKEIFDTVKDIDHPNCGLLGGQPGIALFKSYYFRAEPSQAVDYDRNIQMLFDYFENPYSLNFSMGIAGVLHTLNHLEKEDFFDFGDNLKEFDYSIFLDYISEEPTLDYLHGNSGVILSLLEQDAITDYDPYIRKWFESIEKTREASDDELKWKIEFKHTGASQKGYCLGLAHGFPSIILILLKLYKKKPSPQTLTYIKQSLNFLLNNQQEDTGMYYFPSRIVDGQKVFGRLAWCYGDLGVAYMLYQYAISFDDQAMLDFAIEIFQKHTSKRDHKLYGVEDADFCHGSAGIAHIYARMYNHTQIEAFRETSEYWYGVTLEKAVYADGLAGYKHYLGIDKTLLNDHGLLEGISGIGLCMISAIYPVEPKWDNILLLS